MSRGNPNLDSKAARVRFAVRKKYLSEEDWTNAEIASELNVRPEMVSRYLNNSPHAQEVRRARGAVEQEQWRQLVTDLLNRLDKLSELERQLWDVVEPVVTNYEHVPSHAEIDEFSLQQGGNMLQMDLAPDEDDTGIQREVEVPIPSEWQQLPQFSRLRSVWDERRRTEEQLANILGLDAADELRLSGELTEEKIFRIEDDYPEQDVVPLDQEQSDQDTPMELDGEVTEDPDDEE